MLGPLPLGVRPQPVKPTLLGQARACLVYWFRAQKRVIGALLSQAAVRRRVQFAVSQG
jgi:hypothetical protein